MRNRVLCAIVILSVALLQFGCDDATENERETQETLYEQLTTDEGRTFDPVDNEELRASSNDGQRFAFDLWSRLLEDGKNAVMSPTSVRLAIAQVYAGADGDAKDAIAEAMRFPDDEDALHRAMATLTDALEEDSAATGHTLEIANAVWLNEGVEVLDTYLERIETYYGAAAFRYAFGSNPSGASVINDWISDQTNGLIEDMLSDDTVTATTPLVVANTVYLKSLWQKQFGADWTADGDFQLLDETTVQASFMEGSGSYDVATDDDWQAVDLPLSSETNDKSMLVIMPTEGNFDDFEQSLAPSVIEEVLGALETEDISLFFPKLDMNSELMMTDALKAMGMDEAFLAGADFSRLFAEPSQGLSAVMQNVKLTADEDGVEAAAATVATFDVNQPPSTVIIDRPFYFFVHHKPSGELLFIGRVMDPTQED